MISQYNTCCGIGNVDIELELTKLGAIQHAREIKKTVAIYKEAEGYRFADEQTAREEGREIVQYISKHS